MEHRVARLEEQLQAIDEKLDQLILSSVKAELSGASDVRLLTERVAQVEKWHKALLMITLTLALASGGNVATTAMQLFAAAHGVAAP